MRRKLFFDFADLPQNSVARQVTATEQLGVLCGLNRRTCRRLARTVHLILSNLALERLVENSVYFVSDQSRWSLAFQFVTESLGQSAAHRVIPQAHEKCLRRAGEKLDDFNMTGATDEGFEIWFSHKLGISFEMPQSAELKQWARVISWGDWQKGFERLNKMYACGRFRMPKPFGISRADCIYLILTNPQGGPALILNEKADLAGINAAIQQLIAFNSLRDSGGDRHVPDSAKQRAQVGLARPSIGEASFSTALARLDGDQALLRMQMGFFIRETPQLLANIRASIQQNAAKQLQINAHRLKGLVRSYDDELSAELAWRLEEMGQSGVLTDAQPTYSILCACVDQLTKRIKAYQRPGPTPASIPVGSSDDMVSETAGEDAAHPRRKNLV